MVDCKNNKTKPSENKTMNAALKNKNFFLVLYFFSFIFFLNLNNVFGQTGTEERTVNISANVGSIDNPGMIGGGVSSIIDYMIPVIINVPDINEENIDIKDENTARLCFKKADLNCDNNVDLVDFSILVYWLNKKNFPRHVDIVRDGKIDLKDFSSLAFYWDEK